MTRSSFLHTLLPSSPPYRHIKISRSLFTKIKRPTVQKAKKNKLEVLETKKAKTKKLEVFKAKKKKKKKREVLKTEKAAKYVTPAPRCRHINRS
jgi:hypothetical protein